MKRFWVIWICFCLSGYIMAEALMTTVVGEVYNEQTLEPIPNAHVYIKFTNQGTTTTNEGIFLLRVPIKRPVQVVVSAIGYKKYSFDIEPGQDVGIDIALQEKTTQLTDVFIIPGTNPALSLMKRLRENKLSNTYDVIEENYDSDFAVYLSDINAKHMRKRFWKQLSDGMIEEADSTFLIPLYANQIHDGQQTAYNTIMDKTDYDALLAEVDRSVNFYSNNIPLYGTSFLSPLASNGNTYYNYYLIDSTYAYGSKAYLVHFKTKNAYFPAFNGEMTIDSTTCALLHIKAELPARSNVNYLRALTIEQLFNSQTHLLEEESAQLLLDLAIKADTSRTFPTLLIERSLQLRQAEKSLTQQQHGSIPLHTIDTTQLRQDINKLNNTPIFRVANFMAYIAQHASIPTGTGVDIGKVTEIIRFNPMEKVRLALPLRTNEKLWKNVCLEAYAGYGFADQAWKGMGKIHVNLPTTRRNVMTFTYSDDYEFVENSYFAENMRENSPWIKDRSLISLFFRPVYMLPKREYNYDMLRIKHFTFEIESDWTDNLESQLHVSFGRMGYGAPAKDYVSQKMFRYTRLGATFRLGWEEKKVDSYFHRIHVYSHLPVLFINGEIGSYLLNEERTYHVFSRIRLMMKQQVPLGVMGKLNYILEGGVLFGKVPYPLLTHFGSNASYVFQFDHFSLMQANAYAADNYISLHTEWNGKGCLFNLIPGIQRLSLRELVTFKMLWGSLRKKHEEELLLPYDAQGNLLYTNANKPYIEVGVGIGNLLRCVNVYSVWRVTHPDQPLFDYKWSVRFCFQLDK